MQGSAYGASFAGGAFDLLSFVKQPQTILRCLSWVSNYAEKLASCHVACLLTDVSYRVWHECVIYVVDRSFDLSSLHFNCSTIRFLKTCCSKS